jgi:hypothetical protein
VKTKMLLATASTMLALSVASAWAQATPGFNNKIPEKIMTPDTVQTRIGTLKFFDGLPTKETAQLVFDNLDFLRAVEVFINFLPAASVEAIREGVAEMGATASNKVLVYDKLMDSNSLFLTGNTDTVYAFTMLDLEKDGATVVEIPPGTGPGTVDDAFFRFVIDMGRPGPDQGKGGKYLILPPGYKGEVPEGYFVGRSASYVNVLALRGFLVDGKPDAATKMFKEGLKIYPLSKAKNPPATEFISGSGLKTNTIHANNAEFYKEIAAVIAREPVELFDPELRGLAASIGITKNKPFAPDERMKKILVEAAAVANATARAIAFQTRDPRAYYYKGSQWKAVVPSFDYQFLNDGGLGGRDLDGRADMFYQATLNTPAMVLKIPGVGSQYAGSEHDKDGNLLDGAKTYKLNIPANVPAKDFWSIVVYDPQTRSQLQTPQPFPSKNSKMSDMAANADGSVDLYFGPAAPAGKEKNWIQTVPGKAWFVYLRLYGPLEPWFAKTWQPGEIEEAK